jgi:hypothetical protein
VLSSRLTQSPEEHHGSRQACGGSVSSASIERRVRACTPSVVFFLQLCHIWGMSWTHQKTVPIVDRTLADNGIFSWGAMVAGALILTRRE